MKLLMICLATFFVSFNIFATEITMSNPLVNNCKGASCFYNFYNNTHNPNGGPLLEYNRDDKLEVQRYIEEIGKIVDLGKGSCKSRSSQDTYWDRQTHPWKWLYHSSLWEKLQDSGVAELKPLEGHCYLLFQAHDTKLLVVAFHVKQIVKNNKIVLDEIEMFRRAQIVQNQ